MPTADSLFVIGLILLALLAGYVIGVGRGRALGHRSGRESAWQEYVRQTGFAPPSAPTPQASGPEAPSVTIADFGDLPERRGTMSDGDYGPGPY